jgi:dolichol-phosphate mannosyltransferase
VRAVGLPSMHHGHLGRLVRFGIVGAFGVLVNSAVLVLLAEGFGIWPVAASLVATEVAILSNYSFNDRWTFRAAPSAVGWARRALLYNLVALGGLAISVGVLATLTELVGVHYLLANLCGIASATAWNYLANSSVTWTILQRPSVSSVLRLALWPTRAFAAVAAAVVARWT